ncbi:MAG: hypothetical protein IJZ12_02285 [Clostridia bacterium]|nr:hypothetical protein [Clostridia bacterium]
MEEKENKSTINLLAILLAFIMGLTVGNVDLNALTELKDKYVTTSGHSLINRDNTTTKKHSVRFEAASSQHEDGISPSEKAETEKYEEPEKAPTAETEKQATETDADFFTVYRTPTGKKYHFHPGCAGDNRIVTDIDEATSLGLTPCKTCADG